MGNCCQINQNLHKHSIPTHYFNEIDLHSHQPSIDELKTTLFPDLYSNTIQSHLVTVSLDHTFENTIESVLEHTTDHIIQHTISTLSNKFIDHLYDDIDDLPHEFNTNKNTNKPYYFQDIIDDKHNKYMSQYISTNTQSELFWGIGVENETYLMFSPLLNHHSYTQLQHKRERYSVDYYKNFKKDRKSVV
jgi:hypothetical protein